MNDEMFVPKENKTLKKEANNCGFYETNSCGLQKRGGGTKNSAASLLSSFL